MSDMECECFVTDRSTWLSAASCGYGSGYEPGSQMEWNPDCPVHAALAALVACVDPSRSESGSTDPEVRQSADRTSSPSRVPGEET